ncbi:ABC transporter permease protein [Mycoplasmopsis californica]|uniref:ABC transporter permease protein n=1 Tax=Mycoplasmopsis californica TaxID=2113 RepID=A0A059XM30_9BACT|nr:sugar ABC transporter permease [Mycoplasmopsis californica]AIA29584.1 ABC transporter permease protein [Mycoplasmopsis californica]
MFNEFYKTKSLNTKSRFIFDFTINKQAKRNNAISESVVDRRTSFFVALLLIIPALSVLITFTAVPFVRNIYSAVTDKSGNFIWFANVVDLFNKLSFAVGIRNSFIYGILVLPLSMIISLLISSLIATVVRKSLRGFLQTIFFLPYVTNIVAVSLAFVQIFQTNGVFNQILRGFGLEGNTEWLGGLDTTAFKSMLVMLINGVWGGLAFNILLFTTAMLSVDKNLYRSASIDGVSGAKQFFTITLPSINKTITFIMTMGIINGIKVFPLALFENKSNTAISAGASTIMLFIYHFVQNNQFALAGAASIVLFIIGVTYSTIIRGGFRALTLASINKGESDVWNKIKNSAEMTEFKAKTHSRFSYSTSTW